MSNARPAHTKTDPVLAALEQAPTVPLTEAERKAMAEASPNGPWRTRAQINAVVAKRRPAGE